jgi:2-hydroxy-3-keto-5-methylthiopentenyl-1-phosphate phosphatase
VLPIALWAAFSSRTSVNTALLSSHFGHDKSLEIKPYAALPDGERPILLYAGDGVSDLSAAAETNLLFAKEGKGKY